MNINTFNEGKIAAYWDLYFPTSKILPGLTLSFSLESF